MGLWLLYQFTELPMKSQEAIALSSLSYPSGNGQHLFPQSSQSLPNPIIIPQSTAGNAGLEKEQLALFVEKPQIIITAEKPCPSCGSLSQRLTDGSGPHAGALRCAACDRFAKWVSKAVKAELEGEAA